MISEIVTTLSNRSNEANTHINKTLLYNKPFPSDGVESKFGVIVPKYFLLPLPSGSTRFWLFSFWCGVVCVCVATVSSLWCGFIRTFIQLKSMFLLCQIDSHPLSEAGETCPSDKGGTRTFLCNWLHSALFKGPVFFRSLTVSGFIVAVDPTTDQTHARLTCLECAVNVGEVKLLCKCFISSKMLLKSIGHVQFVLIWTWACVGHRPESSSKSDSEQRLELTCVLSHTSREGQRNCMVVFYYLLNAPHSTCLKLISL